MREPLTPKDLDDNYVKMTAALAAEAMAGNISKEQAAAAGERLQREWRTNRWDAVQRGLTQSIEELRVTGDPAAAGAIRILETFRNDPETPMLREHCDCGGRLIKRQAVDPPEDRSPLVEWRCVACQTLYDLTGNSRGQDPSRTA
jgi:hypothetical protein